MAQILLRRMAGGKTDHEQGEAVRHENTNVFKYTEAICFPSIRHSDHEPQTAKLKLFLDIVSVLDMEEDEEGEERSGHDNLPKAQDRFYRLGATKVARYLGASICRNAYQ